MAARVFKLLLSQEDGSGTAAELAEALQATPAAISAAVRYLIQMHPLTRLHRRSERRSAPVGLLRIANPIQGEDHFQEGRLTLRVEPEVPCDGSHTTPS
jgi:hypothetical protein